MPSARRFPAPWTIEDHDACFIVINCIASCPVAYKNIHPHEVQIISATNKETNEWAVFGPEISILPQARTQQEREQGVQRHESGVERHEISGALLQAITGDVYAQIALANFRAAMRVRVETGFYCYRAIEAMMQSMKSPQNEDDKAGVHRSCRRRCRMAARVARAARASKV